jgi:aminoethylphosphonate catabolism LysR family transcriptional regulator
MPINLGQLRVFEAVTRTGSFTRAAQRLNVTPPAVSLQIRQLEQAHGVRLFDRVRRRVRLTSAGQHLEQYAQRIFALVGDAERALEEARDFTGGQLRIVASGTSAAYYLPPILTRFRRRYPGVRVHLEVGNSQQVRERIVNLDGDVGMLGVETPHPDLEFRRLAEDPLVVIVSPDHSWARRRNVSLADLRSERLILREPGSSSRQLIERRLVRLGLRVQPAMEIASNEVIKRIVEMGNGVSLMSAAIVRREVDGGHLHALGMIGERLTRPIHLVYHRERRDSPLIRAVVTVARVPKHTRSRSS